MRFDPRLTPLRDGVAAKHLVGLVEASRFAEGETRQVSAPLAPLHERPDTASRRETELLFGELFIVYGASGDFVWGQAAADSYVGYAHRAAFTLNIAQPTHRVSVARTITFKRADIKSEPALFLSLGAKLRIESIEGRFARCADGGYAIADHLEPIETRTPDVVATAERLLGLPYLWGGKGFNGIDCSGLVQLALEFAGIAAPRDSDLQEQALGAPIDIAPALPNLKRGDLVFWDGHVGLMRDADHLLHANAHHMAVAAEPLRAAATRIARDAGPITAIKRL